MSVEQVKPSARARRRLVGLARRGAGRARRAFKARGLLRPAVSVILPIYNVEEYLGECLDSIAAQTFDDYELIVVDDGSPDGSRRIAEEYAATDARIRVITRPNGGLGAARNTGVEHARGEFLTFVDSDDALPPRALEALVGSARRTGSQIVVGAPQRFSRTREWRPLWVPSVHTHRRESITIEEFLPLLRNLYTWDKLFRRDFYLAQGLGFREGVAYEDQPIVTQLFARAASIDVVPDTVYRYRVREDMSSISQQTATLKDLRDRITAWEISREVLLAEAPRSVYDGWLQTLFDAHFHWYIGSAGTVDDEYWALLRSAVLEFSEGASPEIWAATPPEKRVAIELVRRDRRADVQELVRTEASKYDRWPSSVRPDGVLLHLPFHDDADLAPELFLLRPEQLTLAHAVENVHWLEEGEGRAVCQLSGWAYLRMIDLAENDAAVAVVVRGPDGVEHRYPSAEPFPAAFPPPVDDAWCDYSSGRFRVDLPLHELMGHEHGVGDSWEVYLEVSCGGFVVVEPVVTLLRSGSAGVIPAADLGDGRRVVADWRQYTPLCFRLALSGVEVCDPTLSGRVLTGRLRGAGVGEVVHVIASAGPRSVAAKVTGPDRSFSLTLPPLPGLRLDEARLWNVSARSADGTPVGLSASWGMGVVAQQTLPTGALTLERGRNAEVVLNEWVVGAFAEDLDATVDAELRVRGRVFGPDVVAVELAVRHLKTESRGPRVACSDGTFDAGIGLRHRVFRFGELPLPVGDHDFFLRVWQDGRDEPVEVPLRMSAALNAELPIAVRTEHHEGRLVRGPANGVRLVLVRPIGDARGRYQQNRLKDRRPSTRLHRGVLFRAYFGERATDNGLSIQAELARRGSDLPVYWAVQDHSVPVPEGATGVVVNSREFYDLLGSVKYYVDNMYQPDWHAKPDGQVIVQTFHGYPFKQMGHPHWEKQQFSRGKIASYDARARDWDYLVSPARYATPHLVRDFAYDGEVLEIGYPRNDVLRSAEADRIRRETRRSLGIGDEQTVVLYAPTFRDYLSADDSEAPMASFFDFGAAHRALGDDFVILIRGHAFNARANERVGSLPGTIDVTDYPEVSDLYLAADAGVVDYSSLRFDFGVTGKPMVFHVPDLKLYQDTRGWLFDFEPTAPGPLVETTEQVVEQLLDLDGVRARHADAYATFQAEYLDLEDGRAGARFVDRVFVPRGDAPAEGDRR